MNTEEECRALRQEVRELRIENHRLKSGAERYWEARWRDEYAEKEKLQDENDRLLMALDIALRAKTESGTLQCAAAIGTLSNNF